MGTISAQILIEGMIIDLESRCRKLQPEIHVLSDKLAEMKQEYTACETAMRELQVLLADYPELFSK